MIRFRLGRIPVEVQPSHLFFALLIGWSFAESNLGGEYGWPQRILSDPLSPHRATQLLAGLLGAAMVVGSVLFHELGHALVSQAFGYSPSIQLIGLGGNTRPNAPGPVPWLRDVLLTLAGPLFGASLAVGSLLALRSPAASSEVLRALLLWTFWANAFWAGLNLLPVTPLDGGRISVAVLQRLWGEVGVALSQALSALVAGAATLWAFRSGNWIGAFLFGTFAVRSLTMLASFVTGRSKSVHSVSFVGKLQRPLDQFHAGDLDGARSATEALLEANSSPQFRSQAHLLLGWIALKQDDGRSALDHFSQVATGKVEPKAMARAHVLASDDSGSIPFWAQAVREQSDSDVVHELAGTLIRLKRDGAARALPYVDMARAYRVAAGVVFHRGRFSEAATLGLASMHVRPDAGCAYETACAFSRAGDLDQALAMLEQARALGFADHRRLSEDPNLASLRSDARFIAWLKSQTGRVGPTAGSETNPDSVYQAACEFALAGDADQAMVMLDRARALGFSNYPHLLRDPDLASLHSDARFIAWLGAMGLSVRG